MRVRDLKQWPWQASGAHKGWRMKSLSLIDVFGKEGGRGLAWTESALKWAVSQLCFSSRPVRRHKPTRCRWHRVAMDNAIRDQGAGASSHVSF